MKKNSTGQTYLSPDLTPPPPVDKAFEKTFARWIEQTKADVVHEALSALRDFTERNLAGPYVAEIRIPANALNLQTFDIEAYIDAAPEELKAAAAEQFGMEYFFNLLFMFEHAGQLEALVLITDDGGQTVTPCTFNAFRDSIMNLTFPPPQADIDTAAAFYSSCYNDAPESGRNIVVDFTEELTGEESKGAPPGLSGTIILACYPPFYDVSKAIVNPEDFPHMGTDSAEETTGPHIAIPARPEAFGVIPQPPHTRPGIDGTDEAEDDEGDTLEAELPKPPSADYWNGLLSLTDRYFMMHAILSLNGRTLAELPEARRAALWNHILENVPQLVTPKRARTKRSTATATPGGPDMKPSVRPRFSPEKRLFGLNAATLGALNPQGLLPGMDDFFADRRGERLPVKAESAGGFALTVPELDVFNAVQKAVAGSGFAAAPLVFKNGFQDLAHLCGVLPQGKSFRELVKAFFSLSFKPVFLKYDHRNVHFVFTGTCWQIIAGFEDLTPEQKDTLDNSIRTGAELPARILGRRHSVIFQPAMPFYEGNKNHYYYEPEETGTALRQLHGNRKRTAYEHYFRQHVLMTFERMRENHNFKGHAVNWTTPPFSLRLFCEERLHMADMFKQRRPGRAFATVRGIAETLTKARYLAAFDFSKPAAATYTVNHVYLSETWAKNAKKNGPENATQPDPAAIAVSNATQPARPATEKPKPRKPPRPVSDEDRKDGSALLAELRGIIDIELVQALTEKGTPPKDATLTDETVAEVFGHIVEAFAFHHGGHEIQLSEEFLKNTLRFICAAIVKRSKPITSLAAYLKHAVPREMSRAEERIAENCKDFRQRYLDPDAPKYNPEMHASIIRRVKAAAHLVGIKLPREY